MKRRILTLSRSADFLSAYPGEQSGLSYSADSASSAIPCRHSSTARPARAVSGSHAATMASNDLERSSHEVRGPDRILASVRDRLAPVDN